MYILYLNIKNCIVIRILSSIPDCVNCVQELGAKSYKYLPIAQQLPMKFFHAFYWDEVQGGPSIDIEKAKEIKKNEFRYLRNPLLEKLDILFMKSIEVDDLELKQQVVAAKESLRNITLQEMPDDYNILLNYIPQVFLDVSELIVNH